MTETTPEYARVVLVPVSNPATAPHLLELATTLVHPEEGRVIALIVSLGDAEAEAKSIETLEPICQQLQEDDHPVELMTEIATSISRGILDAAREETADLLILGLQQPTRGEVVMGTIVESVIETAPCDVLIYRGAQNADFNRVVVPVDGSLSARVAVRLGVMVAAGYDRPMEAIYVRSLGQSYMNGLARVAWSLQGVPGTDRVKRTVVTAQDAVEGILARCTEDDLLVVGFSERGDMERWLFGDDWSRRIVNRAPGPVIMSARSGGREGVTGRVKRRMAWIRPTLTRIEQDDLVRHAVEMAAPRLDYFVLILVSAVLASLGLLLNSPAIIIGAMLVAPLMQPLTATASGLAAGRPLLIQRSAITSVQGILVALLVAIVIGTVLPVNIPTGEMLSRGNPTLLDAAVAIASGFVAAYATARKDIPAALAGVAIAAALMPPLCTIGLGAALRDSELAFGAALLFTANIICITIAGWVVFFWLGMRPRLLEETEANQRLYRAAIRVVVLALVAVVIILALNNEARNQSRITETLKAAFAPAVVVDVDIERAEPLRVIATVRSTEDIDGERVRAVQDQLIADLEQTISLEVVVLRTVRPAASD